MNYSYIKETFNKDLSNNYVLSIQLDPDGFSFYVAEKESINKPLYFLSKRFEKPGISNLTQELKIFNDFDSDLFYKTIIIYHTFKFCLIPFELYNPDNQGNYLRLSHSLSHKENIVSSDIRVIKTKVLFSIPEELNSLINIKFPNAILLHSACPAVNFGIQKSENACIIYHYGTSISISVIDNNELKLFNIFSIRDENDLIYYILNALKSCNMRASVTSVYFSGVKEDNSDKVNLISKYISKLVCYIPELKELNTIDFPAQMLFNHLEGLNCVS